MSTTTTTQGQNQGGTRVWTYQHSEHLPGSMLLWAHTQHADPVREGQAIANMMRPRVAGTRGVLLNEFCAGTTPIERNLWKPETHAPKSAVTGPMKRGWFASRLDTQVHYMRRLWEAYKLAGGPPLDFVLSNVEIMPDRYCPGLSDFKGSTWAEQKVDLGMADMDDREATLALRARAATAQAAAIRMAAVETYLGVFPESKHTVFANSGSFEVHAGDEVLDANGWPMIFVNPARVSAPQLYLPGETPTDGLANDLHAIGATRNLVAPVISTPSMDGARGPEWRGVWSRLVFTLGCRQPKDLVVWFNRPPFGPGPDDEEERFMASVLAAALMQV